MKKKIVIDFNNLQAIAPCGICGDGDRDPNFGDVGAQFFIEGTKELVCEHCAEIYSPAMFQAMKAFERTQQMLSENKKEPERDVTQEDIVF